MLWDNESKAIENGGVDLGQTEMTLMRHADYVTPGKPGECEGEDCPEVCEGADCVDEPEVCLIPEGCDKPACELDGSCEPECEKDNSCTDRPGDLDDELKEMLSGNWLWTFESTEMLVLQINRDGTCDVF